MEMFLANIANGIGVYGLFAASALIICYVVAIALCVKLKHPTQEQVLVMLGCMVFLIVGAKLFGFVSYLSFQYSDGQPLDFTAALNRSGIVFYGGLLGYLLGLRLLLPRALRHAGGNIKTGYDVAATALPLFHGVARLGCYFSHCCYGVVSPHFAAFYESRVPTQLIESAFCLVLFVTLIVLLLRRPKTRGKLLPLYMVTYSVFRFVLEFWRGDAVRGGFWGLSFSQWISVLVWLGLIFWLIGRKKRALSA